MTDSSSSSAVAPRVRPPPKARGLRGLSWGIGLALAAVPPWLEARGTEALREAAARCPGGGTGCGTLTGIEVDASGLHFSDVTRHVAGHVVHVDHARVAWSTDRVLVRLSGVQVTKAASEPSPAPARARAEPAPVANRWTDPTHGIPVDVVVEGTITVDGPSGTTVSLTDPRLSIDGRGALVAHAGVRIEHRLGVVHSDGEWTLRPLDASRRAFRAHGSLQREDAPETRVDAEVEWRGRPAVRVTDPAGGTLSLEPEEGDVWRVVAENFSVGPFVHGLTPAGVITDDVRIGGRVLLDPRGRVRLQQLEVAGLRVDDRRLAPGQVRFAALTIDGTLARREDAYEADLALRHGDVTLTTHARWAPEAADLAIAMEATPCQSVVDAMPAGTADALAGLRVSGTLAAHLDLHVDRHELARLRALDLAEPPDPPPGRLDLSLPFLESCRVDGEPLVVDAAALDGAYRHVMDDGGGPLPPRVLANGADDFAPLWSVSKLARAFVSLEDRRFWTHDGFDREQIERAFWFDVVHGRVRRGASTITQQAARNLWLGVDRSLARKVQEAVLAARLEASAPKQRILELYLNVIELGPRVFGVEAAAQYHFGKPARKLDVLEAVHLAALAPAPVRLSKRFANGEVDAKWRAGLHEHVRRMYRAGLITEAERDEAVRQPLVLRQH